MAGLSNMHLSRRVLAHPIFPPLYLPQVSTSLYLSGTHACEPHTSHSPDQGRSPLICGLVCVADLLVLEALHKLQALDLSGTRVTINGLETFKLLPRLLDLATGSQYAAAALYAASVRMLLLGLICGCACGCVYACR